jgi:hypothetical protein
VSPAFGSGRAGASAPANTVAPVISGSTPYGSTLSCTTGTWTGSPAPTFTYQWKNAGVDIGGATANTYQTVLGDVGDAITCTVTATNTAGSASAGSNTITPTDPAATALAAVVAGYASAPDGTRQGYMGTLISSLMSSGVWAKLDALYVFAATEDQGSRVNWVNPGTYNCTKTGTPTFTVDNGWAASSGNYLDSGFNPTVGSPKFVRNNGHLMAATLTDAVGGATTYLAGISGWAGIQPRSSAGLISSLAHSSSVDNGGANTGIGLYGWNRSASGPYDRYKNGSVFDSPSRTTVAAANANLLIGTHNGSNISTKVVSFVCLGSALTSQQAIDLNSAYAAYMTSIGVSPT